MKVFHRTWPGYLVLGVILLLSCLRMETAVAASRVQANQGVFDFSGWDFAANPVVQLEGEVPFVWNSFAISDPNPQAREDRVRVSASWHKVSEYPLHGYATYFVDLISDKEQSVAIDLGLIGLSHRIYLNGVLKRSDGRPTSSADTFERSSADKVLFSFILPKGPTRIAIEVANHDYIIAGLGKRIFFGQPEAVVAHRFAPFLTAYLLFGAYLVIGLYHFGLYSLRRRDKSSLYFGLFCLTSIPSILVNNEVNAMDQLGVNSVAFAILLASTQVLAMGFLGFFLTYLYETRLPRFASYTLMGVYLLLASASFLDFQIFIKLMFLLMAIGLPAGGIYVYAVIQAFRARKEGAGLMMASLCIILLTSIHDYANFNTWIDSFPLSPFGAIAFLMLQSYLLSARFSRAFRQVEISERAVRKLSEKIQAQHDHVLAMNENLEQLAEEKTREIRSILSNIQLGIFAIQQDQFQIHKDHSQYMKDIFEVGDIVGMNACDLLFAHSNLSSDEKSQASSALSAALGEATLVFQLNTHCLPSELQYMGPSGQTKLLELSWHPVTDQNDCTEKVLVTVRDVTQLRALEEEAHDKKEELQFISELLNIPAESFRRFMVSADDFIQENRKLVNSQSIHLKDFEVLKLLFINMHTMKGSARSLYLKKMTKVFHDVEQYYAHLQNDRDAHWDVKRMNLDLDDAEAILRTYETINQSKLGRKTSGERDIEIPETELMALYGQFLASHRPEIISPLTPSFLQSLEGFFIDTLFTPMPQLLADLCVCTETLARDLMKEPPRIALEIDPLFINGTGDSVLRKIMVHLLRNSLDHGIELPEERLIRHKPSMGTIMMSASWQGEAVILHYRDDGRGLDVEKVRSIAQDKQLTQDAARLTVAEVGELIFYPGLSTAKQVNDVSGRGIGMEAVRSYLQKVGGIITLRWHDDVTPIPGFHAFSFEILLPGALFAKSQPTRKQAAA
ncbi:MAG TPA: 7TM diverse intracellular signaling domain-containing protein [Oligoflexus sp.]|uniref:7TM diverse intracellular signaling domain-containing protein n=1 Tax=Oligoflexus sp. TaxID=1971216 RepID=UPI002D5C413A|nr:7TM diverse intracellular signaling domain-containing protein [Oligoflexus sp.]HYX33510.1 7TM diverse intracellular signaling domain-containing protein [Oligoflexus sp.]